ncbi:MAG: CU044_2847 family protein [Cyanobacteria bacterium J06639_14]
MSTGETVNYYTTNNVIQEIKQADTGLIQLEDGSLVEVQMPDYKAGEISAGFAQHTFSTFSKIEEILCSAAEPVARAAKRISNEQDVAVTAEVEVGISFEGEGNVYVTKSNSETNLLVKLSINTNSSSSSQS